MGGGGPIQGVVLKDVSGEPVEITSGRLMVDLSGTNISASISGASVTISGNAINTSGQVSYGYGTSIKSTALVNITSVSGGVFIGSGAAISVNMISVSGNSPIWVGSPQTPPISGTGYILYHGNPGLKLDVNDIGAIKAFAEVSGNKVTYIANV